MNFVTNSSTSTNLVFHFNLANIIAALNVFDTPPFVFEKMFETLDMYYFSSAEKDLLNREELLEKIYDEFERDIVLIGGTAVEDRLQDDVP